MELAVVEVEVSMERPLVREQARRFLCLHRMPKLGGWDVCKSCRKRSRCGGPASKVDQ